MKIDMSVSFWYVERKKVWLDPAHLWEHNTELQQAFKFNYRQVKGF